jgi:hypothetical protein
VWTELTKLGCERSGVSCSDRLICGSLHGQNSPFAGGHLKVQRAHNVRDHGLPFLGFRVSHHNKRIFSSLSSCRLLGGRVSPMAC